MSVQAEDASRGVNDLVTAWRELREANPSLRIRDAAARLGVSEAELLATGCGETVTRLDGDWKTLVHELKSLGEVKVITRNDSVVHEKTGQFTEVDFHGTMGLVLDEHIDLRVFLNHWHMGFADDVTRKGRRLRSLQFFDSDGTAVHKVYLTPNSDERAYDELVATWRAADQSPMQAVAPAAVHYEPLPDSRVDVDGFRAHWRELKNVHYFFGMLKRFRVGRQQAMRLADSDYATEVEPGAFVGLLEAARESGLPIMIFVGSAGVAQIHKGPVERLKRVGEWFNVLDPRFNLHLRDDHIARAWIVRKPSETGLITSLEVYDAQARLIAQMFGKREPKKPELPDWRELVNSLEPLAG